MFYVCRNRQPISRAYPSAAAARHALIFSDEIKLSDKPSPCGEAQSPIYVMEQTPTGLRYAR